MRLAAIEALGKINEYRGGILSEEGSELAEIRDASDQLALIAEKLFKRWATNREATPTSSPPVAVSNEDLKGQKPQDEQFYSKFVVLLDSQTEIVEIATEVMVEAPLSRTTTAPALSKLTDAEALELSKLADAKTLESSVKKLRSATWRQQN